MYYLFYYLYAGEDEIEIDQLDGPAVSALRRAVAEVKQR
jgi:hypothetical protein